MAQQNSHPCCLQKPWKESAQHGDTSNTTNELHTTKVSTVLQLMPIVCASKAPKCVEHNRQNSWGKRLVLHRHGDKSYRAHPIVSFKPQTNIMSCRCLSSSLVTSARRADFFYVHNCAASEIRHQRTLRLRRRYGGLRHQERAATEERSH